ncbi:MAG: inositol monophosphatase family protein [Myxococcota bacterium]
MSLSRIEALLPDLALAARVALRLQRQGPLELPVKGEHDNVMGQALTIADPVVQAFLEARLPAVRLELEEEPYQFRDPVPEGSQGTIWVDPIDGTRYYADGLPTFGISLAWTHRGRLEGAVYVVPADDRAFVAGRGEGAFEVGLPGTAQEGRRRPVSLDEGEHVVWSRASAPVRAALAEQGRTVVDPSTAYDPTLAVAAWHVLSGPVGAIVWERGAHVRDGAVIAMVAQEAGATVQTLDGTPWDGRFGPEGRTPGLVVATTDAIARVMRASRAS